MKNFLRVIVVVCMSMSLAWAQESAKEVSGTTARKINVGGLTRTYYLHVPPNLPQKEAAALVLMFHGGGGTPAFAERDSKFSDLANREGFLVAYPEGIGKSWNDGRGVNAIVAQRENVDDLGFVAALIDDVNKDFKVDPRRVYGTGISNGAIFSHHLAANMSSRIAAIAPVVGGLSEPLSEKFRPEQTVSVLVLQGTDDPLIPYNGGDVTPPGAGKRGRIVATEKAVELWVTHNNCQREPIEEELPDQAPGDGCRVKKISYANGRDGTDVVLYKIEGGGHTWPNGLQYLPAQIVGKVCRDFNGSEVIWEFFKAHPKPIENATSIRSLPALATPVASQPTAGSPAASPVVPSYKPDLATGRAPSDEEVAAAEHAATTSPDDFSTIRKLGKIYFYRFFGAGEAAAAPKARNALTRALKLKPDDAETLAFLGTVDRLSGREREGIELMAKARKIDPTNIGVLGLLSGFGDVSAMEELRDMPEFSRMSDHGRQRVLLGLGKDRALNGLPKIARELFTEGLEINKDSSEARLLRKELEKLK